jgi:hypothetical protein
MKPLLFTFAFAATLAVQNFIQMSDLRCSADARRAPTAAPTGAQPAHHRQREIAVRLAFPYPGISTAGRKCWKRDRE